MKKSKKKKPAPLKGEKPIKRVLKKLGEIALAAVLAGSAQAAADRVIESYVPRSQAKFETMVEPGKEIPAATPPKHNYLLNFKGDGNEYNLKLEAFDSQVQDLLPHEVKGFGLEGPSPEDEWILKYRPSSSESVNILGLKKKKLEYFLKYYNIDEDLKKEVYKINEIEIRREEDKK